MHNAVRFNIVVCLVYFLPLSSNLLAPVATGLGQVVCFRTALQRLGFFLLCNWKFKFILHNDSDFVSENGAFTEEQFASFVSWSFRFEEHNIPFGWLPAVVVFFVLALELQTTTYTLLPSWTDGGKTLLHCSRSASFSSLVPDSDGPVYTVQYMLLARDLRFMQVHDAIPQLTGVGHKRCSARSSEAFGWRCIFGALYCP